MLQTTKDNFLLAELTKLIAAQTTGEVSGFSTDQLNEAYLGIAKGYVSEDTEALLSKLIGPDWSEGWEPSVTAEDIESEAADIDIAEIIEGIDPTDPLDAVSTLASALMIACRELGWLEASRAAHDQWFHFAARKSV